MVLEDSVLCVSRTIAHLASTLLLELPVPTFIVGAPRYFLPKHRQDEASQPLHVDEWQREIILVDEAKHVEPFRAEHSELLVVEV